MRVWLLALAGCGRVGFGASPDASPDAAPSCGHTFCDDFARTAPLEGPWDSAMLLGGSLSLDGDRLLAQAAGNLDRAFLLKLLPLASTSIHFEADIKLETGMDGEIDLVQLHWHDLPAFCTAGGAFGYFLVRDSTGKMEIQETYVGCNGAGNKNDVIPVTTFPPSGPDVAHHVQIDVMLGAVNSAHVRVQVDALLGVDATISSYDVLPSTIELHLGVPGVSAPTAPWAIHFDNVVVDIL